MNTTDKIRGKTASGFEYELDPDVFDDWDIVTMFKRAYNGDEYAFVDIYPAVLGAEQFERLQDHVRTPDGRVKTSAVNAEVNEIFGAVKEAKKS